MPVDTIYYDLLGVSPTATDLEIKKAYRRQAFAHHPDRNLCDENAAKRFQDLGEAYTVLSNPQSREIYDKEGINGFKNGGEPVEDAAEIFAKAFGDNAFDAWIGEISFLKNLFEMIKIQSSDYETKLPSETPLLTATASQPSLKPSTQAVKTKNSYGKVVKDTKLQTHRELAAQQYEKRVGDLAAKLLERINSAHDDKFYVELQAEVDSLVQNSFGVSILHVIGEVYVSKANAVISSQKIWGFASAVTNFFHNVSQGVKNGKETVAVANKARIAIQKIPKKVEVDDGSGQKVEEPDFENLDEETQKEVAGSIINLCWHTTKLEIAKVLRAVCKKVLYDPEPLEEEEQRVRAQTLLKIGEMFQNAKRADNSDGNEFLFELLANDVSTKKTPSGGPSRPEAEREQKKVPVTGK